VDAAVGDGALRASAASPAPAALVGVGRCSPGLPRPLPLRPPLHRPPLHRPLLLRALLLRPLHPCCRLLQTSSRPASWLGRRSATVVICSGAGHPLLLVVRGLTVRLGCRSTSSGGLLASASDVWHRTTLSLSAEAPFGA
jgi:hypothetical protein